MFGSHKNNIIVFYLWLGRLVLCENVNSLRTKQREQYEKLIDGLSEMKINSEIELK